MSRVILARCANKLTFVCSFYRAAAGRETHSKSSSNISRKSICSHCLTHPHHKISIITLRHRSRLRRQDEVSAGHDAGRSRALAVAYFITDETWALKVLEVLELLNADQYRSTQLVCLPNPGDGAIIRPLLETTKSFLLTWEPRSIYLNQLQVLTLEFPDRFVNIEKSFSKEREFDVTLNKSFKNLEIKDTTVMLIGNITDIEFYIPMILFQSANHEGLWKLGNVSHYLFITGLEFRLMMEAEYFWANRIYQRTSLYKLFFDIQHLLTIPLEAFNRRLNNISPNFNISFDKDNMFMVKLSLKEEWFTSKENMTTGLVQLLKTINRKKAQRIIPAMEQWCPDIGIELIVSLGIGMMDRFKDVPLDIWPKIYKALIESKHYSYSSIKHILENDNVVVVRNSSSFKVSARRQQQQSESEDSTDDKLLN